MTDCGAFDFIPNLRVVKAPNPNTKAAKILAAFDASHTTTEAIMAVTGLGRSIIYKVLLEHGRKLTKLPHHRNNIDRYAEIVRLRREGKTLEEIGQMYGVTRERIRQICVKDDPEFTAADALVALKGPKPTCPVCGNEMRWSTKGTCSRECHAKWKSTHLTDKQRKYGEEILRLRATGMTWDGIGGVVMRDLKCKSKGSHCQMYAKKYAKRTGEDISWAFQGMHGGVRSPQHRERIINACIASGSRFAVRQAAE